MCLGGEGDALLDPGIDEGFYVGDLFFAEGFVGVEVKSKAIV